MVTPALAYPAYGRSAAPIRTPRSIEYDLLAQCTQQLRAGWAQRDQNYTTFVAALADNSQVWSTLATDIAGSGNSLPAALRAQLFHLYEFITQHSREVLDSDAEVGVLIDINTAVMRGLRGDPGTGS